MVLSGDRAPYCHGKEEVFTFPFCHLKVHIKEHLTCCFIFGQHGGSLRKSENLKPLTLQLGWSKAPIETFNDLQILLLLALHLGHCMQAMCEKLTKRGDYIRNPIYLCSSDPPLWPLNSFADGNVTKYLMVTKVHKVQLGLSIMKQIFSRPKWQMLKPSRGAQFGTNSQTVVWHEKKLSWSG